MVALAKITRLVRSMKFATLIVAALAFTACATNSKVATQVAMTSENDKLCENHKNDYNYFLKEFNKEHAAACTSGCTYTPSMNKTSDTMERVAGLYYLMNCDYKHGRL